MEINTVIESVASLTLLLFVSAFGEPFLMKDSNPVKLHSSDGPALLRYLLNRR